MIYGSEDLRWPESTLIRKAFLSPPSFGEELHSFERVRMYVSLYVSCRRSLDPGRKVTFKVCKRREMVP